MDIGILTAFLGGILALLSPCGALLLPAFFASHIGRNAALLLHGMIFYLGLSLTLIPLGLGAGALGSLLTDYREWLVGGTAMLLVVLGVLQIFGFGFDLSKFIPGAQSATQQAQQRSGLLKTFLLGATGGVAGFCAGPILGAILTLAMGTGSTLHAGFMLAIYGLGMVVPLIALAAVWSTFSPKVLRVIRGTGFTVFGRHMHTTSVVTGVIVIAVGVLFWTTNGLITAPSLIPASMQQSLQSYTGILATPFWDMIFILSVLLIGAITWLVVARRKHRKAAVSSDPHTDASGAVS